MKRICLIIILICIQIGLFGHANTVHNSLINDVLDYLESTYGTGNTYYQLISTYPNFFKFGSTLPDMQYINASKPTLESIYSDVNNAFSCSITYEINMDEVPDPDGVNASYSFGINTHNKEYVFAFAHYLLNQANLLDPPGCDPDPNGNNSGTGITSESRAWKLALACGYYAHLVEDIVGHNYWIPKLTAESGVNELNLLNNDAAGLSEIPGIQSHYFIEACHDYSMGESASLDFKNTIYDMYVIGGQVEPSYAWIIVNNTTWTGLNPALDFFYEVLADWYNNNPENLPSDYRYGNLISSTGFLQECHMWRFMNQFYPESLGFGSLPNALSNWISDHTHSLFFEDILGMVTLSLVDWIFDEIVFNTVLESVEPKMGSAVQTLLGISRSDPSLANQIVADNPDKINGSEYTRMLSSPIYTNPNYFSSFDYYAGLEAKYFDEIGPSGYLYNEWAPDNHSAYAWGVLSSLNNLTTEYQMRTDVGVYDFYFLVDGQKYDDLSSFTGVNHNFSAVAELFALEPITQPLNILGELKLDRHGDNTTLDILLKDLSITFSQNPSNYNTVERVKLTIPFDSSDFTNIQLLDYKGIYLDLSIANEQPFFSTNWEIYEDITEVENNIRFDHFDTYTSYPYSYNLALNAFISGEVSLIGGQGDITDMAIHFKKCDNTHEFTIHPDMNGVYSDYISDNYFGYYDITYELYSTEGDYYPIIVENWVINENTTSLPNVALNPIVSCDFVMVSADLNINNAFHTIQDAVDYLYQRGSGRIIILPGVYTGEDNKNISWSPFAFTEGFHIKIHGAPTSSEECIIDCGGSGIGFIFDDYVNGQGPHQYNELDIIENLVIQNADQGIVIANGSPVIRYNKITNCEIDPYAGSDVNGAGISCKSSAYIHDNEITNCTGNWTDANLNYTYGGGIYLQNDTDGAAVIENNLISGCAAQDGGGMYCTGSGEIILDGNTITACSVILAVYDPATAYPDDGIGISSIDCSNITIKNNILRENFPFQTSTEKGAFYAYNCSGIEYSNNTVIQNPNMYGFYIYAGCTTVLKNCIVSENYVGILSHNNLSVEYCCVFNNGTPLAVNASQGDGYITENPQLDPETYQPIWNSTTKSPCIDAGDPDSDLDSDDTPADIGAVCATPHKYDVIELPSPEIDSGWKWLSFPALDDVYSTTGYDPDVAEYLLASITGLPLPSFLDMVELSDGYVIENINNEWQNFGHQFESVNGYKFHMNEAATLDVPGFVENPNTQIELIGDAHNWIGYFLEESQLVTDAFSQIWDDLYVIQHQHWCMTKIGGVWYYWQTSEYPVLEYGDMVNVRCYNTHTDFHWCNDTPGDDKNPVPDSEHFLFTEDAEYIPIYVEFEPEDIPAEVGVFVDSECKGAAVVEGENAQILAYIVEGQQGNLEFEFYYNNRSENKTLKKYNCVSSQNPNQVMQRIDVKEKPDAWLVSFREDSNIVAAPDKVSLRNYPNPFNPTTTIAYGLPYEDKVTLNIYNVKGQLVKQLVSGIQSKGYYEVEWNGKDDSGKTVSSGIYYYQIRACGKTLHKKMLMLK